MAMINLFSKKAALTERDSFALSVLLEMVQAESFNGEFSKEQARIAYSAADAMLAVRDHAHRKAESTLMNEYRSPENNNIAIEASGGGRKNRKGD